MEGPILTENLWLDLGPPYAQGNAGEYAFVWVVRPWGEVVVLWERRRSYLEAHERIEQG